MTDPHSRSLCSSAQASGDDREWGWYSIQVSGEDDSRSLDSYNLISSHGVPCGDLRQHTLRHDGECWCNPRPDLESDLTSWIHNSADRREFYELPANRH